MATACTRTIWIARFVTLPSIGGPGRGRKLHGPLAVFIDAEHLGARTSTSGAASTPRNPEPARESPPDTKRSGNFCEGYDPFSFYDRGLFSHQPRRAENGSKEGPRRARRLLLCALRKASQPASLEPATVLRRSKSAAGNAVMSSGRS